MEDEVSTKEASAWHGLLWILAALLLVFLVIESIPLFASLIPWKWEMELAEQFPAESSNRLCHVSPAGELALAKLVKRIYPVRAGDEEIAIEVKLVREKRVNAFAFLGGKIFIYEGLLGAAATPEELAAVLAHEIEHVRQRHITRALIRQALALTLFHGGQWDSLMNHAGALKFSRIQEEEADAGALVRLKEAHVNVEGFKNFFSRRGKTSHLEELLSDHPADQSRAQMAEAFLGLASWPILSEQEWLELRRVCAAR